MHRVTAPSNWFNIRPGDPAFIIGAHACDWFDLGVREGTDYWLEGKIVDGAEFLFNGRLFLPTPGHGGTIIDNFPKGPIPDGWTKRSRVDGTGYDLVSQNGAVLFGYRAASFGGGPANGKFNWLGDCKHLCGGRRSCCREFTRSIRASPASGHDRAWGGLFCMTGLSAASILAQATI